MLQVRGNGSPLVNKTFSSLYVSFRDTYDTEEEEEEGSPENKTTAKNVIEQRSANVIVI